MKSDSELEFNYIEDRLDKQINYYYIQSNHAKHSDNIFKTIQIISAASATVLTTNSFMYNSIILSTSCTIICLFLVVSQSINAYKKYNENYIRFKITCEALKREKYLYLEKVEPYNKTNALKLLVLRSESIIIEENRDWKTIQKEFEDLDNLLSSNATKILN